MATLPKIAQYFKFLMTIEKKKLAQLSHFVCKSTTMFYMQINHYNLQNDDCVPKHKNKCIFATKKGDGEMV
jgi:hypothetical protein